MRESTPAICENGEPIIQVGEEHSRIFIEPMYYHQKIPNSLQVIYLRQGVYERLTQALLLLPKNFSLILYDGYRPFQVQQFLFANFSKQIARLFPHFTEQEVVRETRKYVAFPSMDQLISPLINFFQRVSKHLLKEVKASGGCHGFGKEIFVRAQS